VQGSYEDQDFRNQLLKKHFSSKIWSYDKINAFTASYFKKNLILCYFLFGCNIEKLK